MNLKRDSDVVGILLLLIGAASILFMAAITFKIAYWILFIWRF